MEARKLLTGFSPEPSTSSDLTQLLAQVGLELWQAPQGFWAVRLKPALVPTPVTRLRLRRPLTGRTQ